MATYKKYDREKYLTDFSTIMDLRPTVENIWMRFFKMVWKISYLQVSEERWQL